MNDIKRDIDNLFDEFEHSKLYEDYLNVKLKLEASEEIMNLIEEIKRLQKIATNNKDENIEIRIKELYEQLEKFPLYQSYLIIIDQINEELFQVKEQFDKYFKNVLKL